MVDAAVLVKLVVQELARRLVKVLAALVVIQVVYPLALVPAQDVALAVL